MNYKKDINYLKETINIYKNMIKYNNIFDIVFDILLTYSINTGVLVVDPREEYTRTLNVSQPDTLQFLHLIYKDSTIYLTRKYNKYLTFCRSLEKSDELLQTNIGELCDGNTEITGETKEFPAS